MLVKGATDQYVTVLFAEPHSSSDERMTRPWDLFTILDQSRNSNLAKRSSESLMVKEMFDKCIDLI